MVLIIGERTKVLKIGKKIKIDPGLLPSNLGNRSRTSCIADRDLDSGFTFRKISLPLHTSHIKFKRTLKNFNNHSSLCKRTTRLYIEKIPRVLLVPQIKNIKTN